LTPDSNTVAFSQSQVTIIESHTLTLNYASVSSVSFQRQGGGTLNFNPLFSEAIQLIFISFFNLLCSIDCNHLVGVFMRRKTLISSVLIVVILILVVGLFFGSMDSSSKDGFTLTFLENNILLISDSDVVSYNVTSQEIVITEIALEGLVNMGNELYNFTGFVIRIDGEEVYQGVFRSAIMSAIPGSPRICVLFPSMFLQSEIENSNAIRMFYPGFEPPSDQSGANAKFIDYFAQANKLIS